MFLKNYKTCKACNYSYPVSVSYKISYCPNCNYNSTWLSRWLDQINWIIQVIFLDFKYSCKIISLIFSQFVCLQYKYHDSDGDYTWYAIEKGFAEDNPYYVCVKFSNGNRLPLPLVMESKGEYKLQNILLSLFRGIGLLNKANRACIEYLELYKQY